MNKDGVAFDFFPSTKITESSARWCNYSLLRYAAAPTPSTVSMPSVACWSSARLTWPSLRSILTRFVSSAQLLLLYCFRSLPLDDINDLLTTLDKSCLNELSPFFAHLAGLFTSYHHHGQVDGSAQLNVQSTLHNASWLQTYALEQQHAFSFHGSLEWHWSSISDVAA